MFCDAQEKSRWLAQVLTFDDVLPLALRLSPLEKIKLVEKVVSTLGDDLVLAGAAKPTVHSADSFTWGAQVLAVLDQMGTSEWEAMDILDVVEWVKEQRRRREEQLHLHWDDPK